MASDMSSMQIGGTTIHLSPLKWPIYESYKIIDVSLYLGSQPQELKDQLSRESPTLMLRIYDELSDPFIIVPENIAEPYEPYEKKANLFNTFTQLYSDCGIPSDQEIIDWISRYGLPFNTSRKSRSLIYGDEGLENDTDILLGPTLYFEQKLEKLLGKYVMFRQTFNTLLVEAYSLLQAYVSLNTSDINKMDDAISTMKTVDVSETYWMFKSSGHSAEQTKQFLQSTLSDLLYRRLIGYINNVSPSFDIVIKNTEPFLELRPAWRVPDLWSCLMLQLYEFVLKNQPARSCKNCGKMFLPWHKNIYFCPAFRNKDGTPNQYTGRSTCQNRAAVKRHRNPTN